MEVTLLRGLNEVTHRHKVLRRVHGTERTMNNFIAITPQNQNGQGHTTDLPRPHKNHDLKSKGLGACAEAQNPHEVHAELVRVVWSWCVYVRRHECLRALAPHEDVKNKY